MVLIEAGAFLMGTGDEDAWQADGEGPVREVRLDSFWMDTCCVTNDEFASFVEETGYVTEAEHFGWSFVFSNQIPKNHRKKAQMISVMGLPWWARIEKATWRKPGGPGTNINKLGDHPVVHVSWNDAMHYAEWMGKRLPTEAEWEVAARGGHEQKRYPWGDELTPGGRHCCNIWQGKFPENDTGADGYTSTAPVRSFRPNDFGMYNTSGNVWEWIGDWFDPRWHLGANMDNPTGPPKGDRKVIKGGSFLCHESYCNRYRTAARTGNTPDSSTCHTGFRCAMSVSA